MSDSGLRLNTCVFDVPIGACRDSDGGVRPVIAPSKNAYCLPLELVVE
jgi:hypothetical protein